jgi:hypothetical protein
MHYCVSTLKELTLFERINTVEFPDVEKKINIWNPAVHTITAADENEPSHTNIPLRSMY